MAGGWVSGTLAMACVAAAVVLGGATAAVQLVGTAPADPAGAWLTVVSLFSAGVALAAIARVLFAAAERERSAAASPMPAA
jgi:hypothetical protein